MSGAHGGRGGDEGDADEKPEGPPTEFDCPDCNANNPCDALRDKDEVLCLYCGSGFEVRLPPQGKMKLKAL